VLAVGWVPLAALVRDGWVAAGLAIGLAYAVQFSPAAVAAARSADLSGVSAPTWSMAWIEAVTWFAYGIAQADAALVVGGAGGALMASAVLVRLWTVGERRADEPPEPAILVPDAAAGVVAA
jgi:hypothetical protein